MDGRDTGVLDGAGLGLGIRGRLTSQCSGRLLLFGGSTAGLVPCLAASDWD